MWPTTSTVGRYNRDPSKLQLVIATIFAQLQRAGLSTPGLPVVPFALFDVLDGPPTPRRGAAGGQRAATRLRRGRNAAPPGTSRCDAARTQQAARRNHAAAARRAHRNYAR